MNRPQTILTKRLREYIAPWMGLGAKPITRRGLQRHLPVEYCEPAARDANYDYGRLRYFYELLRAGGKIDPIEIDNVCSPSWPPYILPEPLIDDGHHRFWAALLANVERIPVSYSGRMDVLRYLQGKRETPPQ